MSMALLLGLIWSGLWMAYIYVIMKCFPWEMALLFAGIDYAVLYFIPWR